MLLSIFQPVAVEDLQGVGSPGTASRDTDRHLAVVETNELIILVAKIHSQVFIERRFPLLPNSSVAQERDQDQRYVVRIEYAQNSGCCTFQGRKKAIDSFWLAFSNDVQQHQFQVNIEEACKGRVHGKDKQKQVTIFSSLSPGYNTPLKTTTVIQEAMFTGLVEEIGGKCVFSSFIRVVTYLYYGFRRGLNSEEGI